MREGLHGSACKLTESAWIKQIRAGNPALCHALEYFVIPSAHIFADLLMVLADDIYDAVVRSVCLVLVGREITVESSALVHKNRRI